MSNWLSSRELTAQFLCPVCGCQSLCSYAAGEFEAVKASTPECVLTGCSGVCHYEGTAPAESASTRITFEKNGRIGIRSDFSNGKSYIRSATKENYLNNGDSTSVKAKGCPW